MEVICKNCKKPLHRLPNEIKKSKNHFCDHSCAAIYNNKHSDRKYGPAPQNKCLFCNKTINAVRKYCSDECLRKNKKPINRKRSKAIVGKIPFNNYWIYGPYLHKQMQRNMIFLIPIVPTDKRTTISYARYLMSLHLKRNLTQDEEVDHIDGNKSNDTIINLQILSRKKNQHKYVFIDSPAKKKMVFLCCPECLVEFIRPRNQTHLLGFKNATFCSRKCCGKFTGRKNREDVSQRLANNIVREYVARCPSSIKNS